MRKGPLPIQLATAAILLVLLICEDSDAGTAPLRAEGGTFVVPVLINDKIPLDFTLDSGASEVSIPLDVFLTLRRTNTIAEGDLLEPRTYTFADGSSRKEIRFRIHSLRVGNLELHDVEAAVAPVKGDLLLGQSFLSRLRTWSVDNERHLLLFNEREQTYTSSEPAPIQSKSPGYPAEPDYSCGAAQNLCRDGARSLCSSYREDFRREHRICPGVYDGPISASAKSTPVSKDPPFLGEYACGAARNICSDGPSPLCESYRQDFLRAGRVCFGVTDPNP